MVPPRVGVEAARRSFAEPRSRCYSPSMSRLFLLDGTALAYRAHFAMARSGLSTADGRPSF